jgi:hypothetical protein
MWKKIVVMREPKLLDPDFAISATMLREEGILVLVHEAVIALELVKALTYRRRWWHRKIVQTRWPLFVLTSYALKLFIHVGNAGLAREGFEGYSQILGMVSKHTGRSVESIEGSCHQDVLGMMGELPEWARP